MKDQIAAVLMWMIGLISLTLFLAGCSPKQRIAPDEKTVSLEEPYARGNDYAESPDLISIYFDLDDYAPQYESIENIHKNAQVLKDNPEVDVQIQGNCDERGGAGYNLGLGQRRAAALRDYYIAIGIDGNRIATLSYGKEMPVCEEHTGECWQKNRRADTFVRVIR